MDYNQNGHAALNYDMNEGMSTGMAALNRNAMMKTDGIDGQGGPMSRYHNGVT